MSSPNPFLAIRTAMNREGPKGVLLDKEAVSAEAMLYAYTINAAKALRRADRIGSIEPGKAADFALVDRDVLSVSAKEIGDTKVVWTMYGGKKVYEARPQ